MQSAHKSNFAELVDYIRDEQHKYERVGSVRATNCGTQNIDMAVLAVLNTQDQNTRAVGDKTYHLIVSFPSGERPQDPVLQAIEANICEGLGFKHHQRVSAVHHDTDNLHLHIAINKIHPQRHTMHDPFNAYYTLGRLCERLEHEYGLKPDNHAVKKTLSENKAQDMECHAGVESLLGWIQRQCRPALLAADSWQALHGILASHSLTLKERGNGLIISDPNGLTVKASSVARELSKAKLEGKLGAFVPAVHHASHADRQGVGVDPQPAPAQRYQAKPIHWRTDTTALYQRYRNDQERLKNRNHQARQQAQAKKQRQLDAAKQAHRLKRNGIKLMAGTAAEKKLLYHLASQSLKTDLQRIRREYQQDTAAHRKQNAPLQWADWLRRNATLGDQEALAALRAREAAQGLKGNTLGGQGGRAVQASLDARQDSITKKGTIIYQAGRTAIRDDGGKLSLSQGSDAQGLEKALRMAMERYGDRITVNGDSRFKQDIVRAAVKAKLPIRFTDAKLEQERQLCVMRSRTPPLPPIGQGPVSLLRKPGGRSPTQSDLPKNTDIPTSLYPDGSILFVNIQDTGQGLKINMHKGPPGQYRYASQRLANAHTNGEGQETAQAAPERKRKPVKPKTLNPEPERQDIKTTIKKTRGRSR